MICTLTILAFLIAFATYPLALRFAIKHNIVDNPDARKLQKEPVPVFGGVVVLLGIVIPLIIAAQYFHFTDLWYNLGALILLFAIGITDDIRGLSAIARFLIEILLVWLLVWHPLSMDNGPMLDHLHGLFGRGQLSLYTAIPLTIVGGVGLINAINLIDGVDGYSSGYGIVNNLFFALLWYLIGNAAMLTFSLITAAALVSFYLHNVFGQKSKMFIGDSGSLILGLILSINVTTLLSSHTDTTLLEQHNVGLVALALAIAAIPVFDTLRVMTARIVTGGSPFSPDKTHLHHAFISLDFSHVATSSCIIFMNMLIVAIWYVCFRIGCSITTQCVVVVLLGIFFTVGVYYGFRYAERKQNKIYFLLRRLGAWTHFKKGILWHTLEQWIDRSALCR